MSKQTLILIIFLTLFTGGLLVLALNKSSYRPKVSYQRPIPSIIEKMPVAETSLSFGDLEVVLKCPRTNDQYGPLSYAVTGIFERIETDPGGGKSVVLKQSPASATEEYLRATDKEVLSQLGSIKSGTVITLVSYRISSQSGANPPFSCLETNLSTPNSSFVPSSSSSEKTYSLPIIIKSGTNKVTAVQLELAFDPNVLTNVKIQPSTFFVNPAILINQINTTTGRISYALGVARSERGKQGEGTIAILTFQAKTPGLKFTTIDFLSKTLVTSEGIQQSALKSTATAEISVGK